MPCPHCNDEHCPADLTAAPTKGGPDMVWPYHTGDDFDEPQQPQPPPAAPPRVRGELEVELNRIADTLPPVAGYLMHVACSNGRVAAEPDEHDENCVCQCCRAFVATQQAMTDLEAVIRSLAPAEAKGATP